MDDAQRRGMRTDRIERCLDSGMTIGEWCELNKVGEFNLCKWMARLRKEELALIHFHGHADERLLPMLGDHDRLVVRLHRASKCGSIFMILNWNTNAHLRRFPFALVLFLELRNLVCPKPVARRFPFRHHGRRRESEGGHGSASLKYAAEPLRAFAFGAHCRPQRLQPQVLRIVHILPMKVLRIVHNGGREVLRIVLGKPCSKEKHTKSSLSGNNNRLGKQPFS